MSSNRRIVFDTNIYISAIVFGGNPRTCLELAREGEIELFTSKAILLELATKLSKKFYWETEEIEKTIKALSLFSSLVSPREQVSLIQSDPPDNRILECAKETKAHFIISGDKKHLLSLKQFEQIPIVSAKEFLSRFLKN